MDTAPKKSNKVWIIVGVIAGLCLIGVVVLVIGLGMVGKLVNKTISMDPASAARTAQEIADFDLPQGYSEYMGMNLMGYRLVMIGPAIPNPGPIFALAQFSSTAGMSEEQMIERLKQNLEQQTNQRYTSMKVVETRPMTIRGEDTEAVISEGSSQNGQTFRQLFVTFPGKNGQAMLMVQDSLGNWDEELIYGFIGSIR